MRPWLLFALGLLVAAAGLGWLSSTLVRLDERALLSENTRLALWRLELALARLLSTESARPAADPLPAAPLDGVRAHFDLSPDGGVVTTAQAEARTLLSRLAPALRAAPLPTINLPTSSPPGASINLPASSPPGASIATAADTQNNEFNRRSYFANNALTPPEPASPAATMVPAWYGDELVLSRRVQLPDGVHVQGAWLHWPQLRAVLLREVKDLLPDAQLEPVKDLAPSDTSSLASLPVRLVPGTPANVDPERTSVAWVLVAAWLSFAFVAGTLGLLLFGTLALDARRAAFVSAVTHELRTPLTTFTLYAEMLEAGMVPDEKRQDYLRTLRQEAARLGALVENVLAYAQIEKGRAQKPLEVLAAAALFDRVMPRLEARGSTTFTRAPVPDVVVRADRVSVEQVLFNLVDNARKHAPGAAITLAFTVTPDRLLVTVSDEGPGVAPEVARALFEPFRRSAAQAAEGAQGIGLGLALSRRLARAMGGELRHRPATKGARFELSLARVTSA